MCVPDVKIGDGDYQRRLQAVSTATRRYSLDGPASTYQSSYVLPFQRWFKFKEAYSPELVFEVLRSGRGKPRMVCDPFGGSGTTALACQYLGIPSLTFEVNPFLVDVIRAKTDPYTVAEVKDAYRRISTSAVCKPTLNALRRHIRANAPKTLIEPGVESYYVFPRDVANRILSLRIAAEAERDERLRRLFKVLLAAVLVPTSNVVINGKGRRYRRGWEHSMASSADVDALFCEQVEAALGDVRLQRFKTDAACIVVEGDARAGLASRLEEIDVAIFSPPYPNSFDYTDIYNVELWLLGYLNSVSENRNLRLRTLRSHVQIKHAYEDGGDLSAALSKTIRRLKRSQKGLWNQRIPDMLRGYFADLRVVLLSLSERMSDGGVITCIIGDSLYADVLVDVPVILEEMFHKGRLQFAGARTLRRMTASAQHDWRRRLKESLITFTVKAL